MRVFVGIDWGSKVHAMCCIDPDGKRLWEGEVAHQGDAIGDAIERAVALANGDPSNLLVSMEAPQGVMIEAFADRGAQVFHINPKQLDRFRDRYSNAGAKDDDLDAFVLADTLRTDRSLYREVVIPEPMLLRLREVNRTYDGITKQVLALANQVCAQLQRYYPQMLTLGRWHEEAWLWELFEKAPTPSAVRGVSTSSVKHLLKKYRIRRYKPIDLLKSLGSKPLPVAQGVVEATSERIALLLPMLRVAHQQRLLCSSRLKEILETCSQSAPVVHQSLDSEDPQEVHRDAAIILSLPGIGIHNGATILAEASVALQQRDYQAFRRLAAAAPVSLRTGGKQKRPRVTHGNVPSIVKL